MNHAAFGVIGPDGQQQIGVLAHECSLCRRSWWWSIGVRLEEPAVLGAGQQLAEGEALVRRRRAGPGLDGRLRAIDADAPACRDPCAQEKTFRLAVVPAKKGAVCGRQGDLQNALAD